MARFFADHFPEIRPVQQEWRGRMQGVPTTSPPGGVPTPPWSTIGTAFDYRARFYFHSDDRKYVASSLAPSLDLSTFFVDQLEPALKEWLVEHDPGGRLLPSEHEERLCRFCWALALYEQFARARILKSPLLELGPNISLDSVLGIPAVAFIEDLSHLSAMFYQTCGRLFGGEATLNPTFDGSGLIGGADADLIVDGCLIEMKTTINPALQRDWLYQLLGYILLDFSDTYCIRSVGIYMSRQSKFVDWPLAEFLNRITGAESVDLPGLRRSFETLLRGLAAGF